MDALEQMYQSVILDEYRAARGKVAKVETAYSSHQYNSTCGDDITVGVEIEGDVISKIVWAGAGCSISLASASIAVDLFAGKSVDDAHELISVFKELMSSQGAGLDAVKSEKLGNAVAFTGTSKFPGRIKCALLSWLAILGALQEFGGS
jgi:nitrogen fixation NifU-like protein